MKKTLLAAALLAGFAGAASAQSSVTLYGIVDIGLQYQSISADNYAKTDGGLSSSRFGMSNGTQNGSRWGLRGTEDLGNGLRAVFVLEQGFDSADGAASSTRAFHRQSTLGLASNAWGQVDFGRQTNMASKYFAAVDPFGLGFSTANAGAAFTSANTVRYSNMVLYQTPSISGFNAGVGYSFDTQLTGVYNGSTDPYTSGDSTDYPSMNNMRAATLGLNYANGPLYLMASYDQLWGPNNTKGGAPAAKPKAWLLGGTYDFKVVKLALAYGQQRGGILNPGNPFANMGSTNVTGVAVDFSGNGNGLGAVAFNQDASFNSYLVGLTAPIGGAHKVFGSWTMAQPSASMRDIYNGKNQNTYSLGYTYDFSKRTNLYAYVSYQSNIAFVDSAKATTVGTGIRHRF